MARTTRSKAASGTATTSASKATSSSAASATARMALCPDVDAKTVFLLPVAAAPTARIVTLPHPRYGKPTRFLACPETGLYEFSRVAAPPTDPRSFLVESLRTQVSTATEGPSIETIGQSKEDGQSREDDREIDGKTQDSTIVTISGTPTIDVESTTASITTSQVTESTTEPKNTEPKTTGSKVPEVHVAEANATKSHAESATDTAVTVSESTQDQVTATLDQETAEVNGKKITVTVRDTSVAETRVAESSTKEVDSLPSESSLTNVTDATDATKPATSVQDTDVHILQHPQWFLATPIDPLFLCLPGLAEDAFLPAASEGEEGRKRFFLSSDEYLDRLPGQASHLRELLRHAPTRARWEARMAAVCDTVTAGEETMFRLHDGKLLDVLMEKARRMSAEALPASLEERFVQKPLTSPLVAVPSQSAQARAHAAGSNGTGTDPHSSADSNTDKKTDPNSSADSNTDSNADTNEDAPTNPDPSNTTQSPTNADVTEDYRPMVTVTPEIVQLQRLRVALDLICARYLPPTLDERLHARLALPRTDKADADADANANVDKADSADAHRDAQAHPPPADFTPLVACWKRLAAAREEAVSMRSMGDFSRKHARGRDDDDAAAAELEDARAEKRRRVDDDKKKLQSQSRAVKQLKKANTQGMKKLSAFFTKA